MIEAAAGAFRLLLRRRLGAAFFALREVFLLLDFLRVFLLPDAFLLLFLAVLRDFLRLVFRRVVFL